VLYDPRVTALHSIAPVLIIVISLADTIFVLNAYVRAKEGGLDQREAIARALGEVGPACVLTSISTFFSFASFLLIPATAMQLLGIVTGTGVASALLLVVTLGPILLDIMPTPQVRTGRSTRRAIDGLVDLTRRLAYRRPRIVVGVALLGLCGSAFLVTRLEVETDWARRMNPDHRMPRAEQWVKERFGGFSSIEVVWQTPADALAPEILAAQAAFAKRVSARDDVIVELSAATALSRMKSTLTGDKDAPPPATRAEVAQLMLLAELGGDDPLAPLLSADRAATRTVLRVEPTGLRELAALAAELDAAAHELAPAGVHVDVTGLSVTLGGWLENMLAAQVRGLGLVALMTVLVLTFGLRSFRAGAFALLPNSLPVLFFLASLARPGAHFDSDYLLVCVVGLGIAVDDTIHFLTRYRSVTLAGASQEEALSEAYRSAGAAMVETTTILVIGLSPLLFSDYLSARMFFTELSKVLAGALIADLLLLPAMIRLGWIRFSAVDRAAVGQRPESPAP
jgi:predicted RND superfamily exporter protein